MPFPGYWFGAEAKSFINKVKVVRGVIRLGTIYWKERWMAVPTKSLSRILYARASVAELDALRGCLLRAAKRCIASERLEQPTRYRVVRRIIGGALGARCKAHRSTPTCLGPTGGSRAVFSARAMPIRNNVGDNRRVLRCNFSSGLLFLSS